MAESVPEPGAVRTAAETALRLLRESGATAATAESLTGGMIGSVLTGVSGASAVYRGGVIAYATDLKSGVLGVPAELLEREGAVHPEVARHMATGVKDRLVADFGLAVTGVAGPESQDGRPVGRVYIAVAGPGGHADVREFTFPGDRHAVRTATTLQALRLLADSAGLIRQK
ncbi:PncC family amidohydrolase [Nocardiopsis mwathae]|uniref:PncC family amidohydrolase n=1 Tax=Nocardiopsis mwathae TaxID=1472723 RepID=A0A7X0D553_9ACTN|nr:nicotinamide-nucleotide amidohydrolase family protein [Nocardiopsis mwathae]MBB6170779.1 PncC family amidohydrolase [Nocardiopsis mwathae]